MRVEAAESGAVILEDFDEFFRSSFPGVARAAALVARDPGTGQDLAQEAFFRLYDGVPRCAARSTHVGSCTASRSTWRGRTSASTCA